MDMQAAIRAVTEQRDLDYAEIQSHIRLNKTHHPTPPHNTANHHPHHKKSKTHN